MTTETEVKYRLDGLDQYHSFIAKLNECGAELKSYVLENNMLFDWSDGRLRLEDSALRLRLRKGLEGDDSEYLATVTFKGPRRSGIVKIRKEVEYGCDDAVSARKVFESLGMQMTLHFEKRRRSFEIDGCLVELDEMPNMGFFLEIEADSVEQIEKVAALIGADSLQMEHRSYPRMVRERLPESAGGELCFD